MKFLGSNCMYRLFNRGAVHFGGYLFERSPKFGFSRKENLKFSLSKCRNTEKLLFSKRQTCR